MSKIKSIYQYKATSNIKDVDIKSGIVTGYISTFGTLDKVGDIVEKGAFKKTLSDRKDKILMLKNHSWNDVVGKFDVLKEDNTGLYFEKNLLKGIDINGKVETTQTAKDLLVLYAEGVISEHSFGYQTINAESKVIDNEDVTILTELKVFEGSSLTVEAANPFTPFTGFKACNTDTGMIANILKQMDLINKSLKIKSISDETILKLNMQFLQLQQMFIDLEPLIKSTPKEPRTLKNNEENQSNQINYLLNLMK